MDEVVMTFANGDGWDGIYINGVLELEGHSIHPIEAAELAMKHKVTRIEFRGVDLDWLYEEGSLPENLAEVRWE